MKLTSLMDRDHVFARLAGRTKEAALREVLVRLRDADSLETGPGKEADVDELLALLLEREAQQATVVGPGVGYPHARREGFDNFVLALATVPEGIDYGGPGDEPVRLLFLAIAPPEKNALLLGVMACMSEVMGSPEVMAAIVGAPDDETIWRVLDETGLEVRENITAGDLIKRRLVRVPPEMPLAEVAALMHAERLDVLPVVAEDDRLVGEISARCLFEACMPPYFASLPSMNFARNFDAFEHFFRAGAGRSAGECLDRDLEAIDVETPLAAVIARLARPGVSRLYVCEGGRLVGTIDSFSIIDKVLSI